MDGYLPNNRNILVREMRGSHNGTLEIGSESYERTLQVHMTDGAGVATLYSRAAGAVAQIALESLQIESYGAAALARSIPYYSSAKPYCFLQSLEVSQVDEEPIYNVTCKYGTQAGDQRTFDQRDWEGDPRLVPWQIGVGFQSYKRAADKGYYFKDGQWSNTPQPITNSANDLFTTPWEEEKFTVKVSISRPENDGIMPGAYWQPIHTFDPLVAGAYMGAINSDTVNIAGIVCGPFVALMRNVQASTKWWMGIRYYEVAYEIELNPETWVTQLLDQGNNTLDPSDGVTKHVITVGSEAADHPSLLDGFGQQLPKDAEPVFRTYMTKGTIAFTPLGLF